MNATDSFLVPLSDAGRLSGLKGGPLGPRFRFWRDQDGRRHVFSVYDPAEAPDYSDALAVVARRTPAGPIALWAGPTGAPARRAAARFLAEEIHVHVFGDDPPETLRALLDPTLRGAGRPDAPRHDAVSGDAASADPSRRRPACDPASPAFHRFIPPSRRHAA
ncbi:hypothetical protein [Aquabacter spiritensis]|nr:hypothetical protein [Aquabacter spiritensis]